MSWLLDAYCMRSVTNVRRGCLKDANNPDTLTRMGDPVIGMIQAAYRIDTPRLVIRSWTLDDAEALNRAHNESREHLAKTLVWAARELPRPLSETIARIKA